MMSAEKTNRIRWLHIRLTEHEHSKIQDWFEKTTCRKISEYARKILLNKPITFNQRNQSLDDFMGEMIILRNELNAIGNNFNQSVKKLHTLDTVSEIKLWVMLHESQHVIINSKIEQIKNKITQLSDLWLQ